MSVQFLRYYKTDSPELLAAAKDDDIRIKKVLEDAKFFADLFKGGYRVSGGFAPHFLGICFNAQYPAEEPQLWTKGVSPLFLSQPRVKGVPQRLHEQAAKLRNQYAQHFPKESATPWQSEILGVLGLNPTGLGHTTTFFMWDGKAYIATGWMGGLSYPEILGSEFIAAELEFEKENK